MRKDGNAVRLFTQRERDAFERICKLRQNGVLSMMRQVLVRKYGRDNVISTPAYVIAKGEIPVALIAHADTVFKNPPVEFFYDKEKNVMWSPDGMGADDRAGIFAISKIVASGLKPHVIITTDEECGCVGSNKLIQKYREHPFDALKFMIQLDRRGVEDSVYYDCANPEFEKFINDFGFKTAWGSFTDISTIAPIWGVSAVNFSVGYFEEHSKEERLYVDVLFKTIEKTQNILEHVANTPEVPVYEYIEDDYGYSHYRGSIWYDYGPYGLQKYAQGEAEICCFCGKVARKEDLLRLHYEKDPADYYICNDCYSDMYEDIEWCCECKEGWFLTNEEKNSFTTGLDRTTWKCRNCRGENNDGNECARRTVEGSNCVISGSVETPTEPGTLAQCLAYEEGEVPSRTTAADLRVSGTYYF